MKSWIGRGLLLAALACLAAVAGAEEYWLKYRFSSSMTEEIPNLRGRDLPVSTTLSASWNAPKELIDPVTAGVQMAGKAGENYFPLIFARDHVGAPSRNRLYVGRNGQWDPPLAGKKTERSWMGLCFGPIRLSLKQDDGTVEDYHLCITLDDKDPRYLRAQATSACCYEDQVELEGKTHRVALVDTNCNGRFCDAGKDIDSSDWLMIDLNDDGRLDSYGPSYKEVFTVGKYFKFSDKFYQLTVAPDGACFKLDPFQGSLGKIRCAKTPCKEFTLYLVGENGMLRLDGRGGEAEVPCGQYQFQHADFQEPGTAAKDSGYGLLGQQRREGSPLTVTITADKPAELAFGPPLIASVIDRGKSPEHNFSFNLVGRAGEEYRIQHAGAQSAVPRLKVEHEGISGPPQIFNFQYG